MMTRRSMTRMIPTMMIKMTNLIVLPTTGRQSTTSEALVSHCVTLGTPHLPPADPSGGSPDYAIITLCLHHEYTMTMLFGNTRNHPAMHHLE
jgi:hypothetical protein